MVKGNIADSLLIMGFMLFGVENKKYWRSVGFMLLGLLTGLFEM